MSVVREMLIAAHRATAAVAGLRIRYTSAGRTCEIDAALRGHTEYETIDATGTVRTQLTDADFILVRDDLVLGARLQEPARGDQVTILDGPERGALYEVLPPPGLQCWRKSDPHGALIRIHTKQILDPQAA